MKMQVFTAKNPYDAKFYIDCDESGNLLRIGQYGINNGVAAEPGQACPVQ